MATTVSEAPGSPPSRDGRAGPNVLLFTKDGDVADVYRAHLPPSWTFAALADPLDEDHKRLLLSEADAVIHMDQPITRDHLAAAKRLVLVHRQGVGVDALDLAALREHGVAVAICPEGTPESVAEHAIMLMLAAGRHLVQVHDEVTRQGLWPKWDYRLRSLGLQGARVGIVGFGRIGQAVATRVMAFGSEVLVYRHRAEPLSAEWASAGASLCPSLDDLFAHSDIVTLHCPLNDQTRGMVDDRLLRLMPPHGVLVNTARGGLVVEPDLVSALAEGRLSAAGLDVLSQEPPPADHPLFSLPSVVLTAHSGAGTRSTQHIKAQSVMSNIARMWSGQPLENRVL